MQYFYAILWFAIGLILIFSVSRENKVFYFAGGFFLLLGAWWLMDALLPEVDMFRGGWGIALRCITGVALLVLACSFVRNYRLGKQKAQKEENGAGKKDGE